MGNETYITPVRLNKCNPDIPDLCFKCGKLQGTCFHCVWECEEVQKLWIDVSNYVSQLTSSPIPLNPVLCVLNMYEDECSLPTKEKTCKFVSVTS